MKKDLLLSSLIKEMKICRRLFTKIPADKYDFRPREGVRSIHELLQYLSWCGSGMMQFWLQKEETDFRTYFGTIGATAKQLQPGDFLEAMDRQIETVTLLFSKLSESDLDTLEITFPWGDKGKLGEGILETAVKWTAAYKLQLFFYLKLCTDQKLGTPDAWRLTEL